MSITLKSSVVAAAVLVSITASAQPYERIDPMAEIEARHARQEERIERGYSRGQLSRDELRTLRRGQREFARAKARAEGDGRLTRQELRHLNALLDRNDHRIRQLRHDQDAPR